MKKRKLPKKNIRKLAKFHAIASLALFALYIALSAVYSPEFLLSDIKHKFSALANDTISITARVLGPPIKPIVTGTANCSAGILSNSISWPSDENSQSFSIERDGLPLVSGLTSSNYSDNNIVVDTTYSYVVTAHGSMGPGFAISDPIAIATPTECLVPLPTPELTISLLNASVIDGDYIFETRSIRPTFSGTTNIPFATIDISINGDTIIISQTTANAIGFWTWTPAADISVGPHTIFATATDPTDSLRFANTSMLFEIESDGDEATPSKSNDYKKKTSTKKPTVSSKPIIKTEEKPAQSPIDFSLSIENENVFAEEDLIANIKIAKIAEKYLGTIANFEYIVFDAQGNKLFSFSSKKDLQKDMSFSEKISLPKYLKDGQRKLQVTMTFPGYCISKEAAFTIKPRPLVNLGGGIVWTYPQFLSSLGTISLTLLALLLLWIFLFSREYWLYLHALRHITEKNLGKLGLISLKKKRR